MKSPESILRDAIDVGDVKPMGDVQVVKCHSHECAFCVLEDGYIAVADNSGFVEYPRALIEAITEQMKGSYEPRS